MGNINKGKAKAKGLGRKGKAITAAKKKRSKAAVVKETRKRAIKWNAHRECRIYEQDSNSEIDVGI